MTKHRNNIYKQTMAKKEIKETTHRNKQWQLLLKRTEIHSN